MPVAAALNHDSAPLNRRSPAPLALAGLRAVSPVVLSVPDGLLLFPVYGLKPNYESRPSE